MNRSQQRCRRIWTFSLLCISLVACSLATQAQEQGSEDTKLVVAITDSSGAPIAGASVTISQEGCECAPCPANIKNCESECCETRTSKPYCCIVARRSSADNGEATFRVRGGIYKARVEVQGFKSLQVEGIQVSGGETKKVELKMDVGNVAALVEVSKAAPEPQAKIFTLNFGQRGANAIVTVKKAGCSCGECPQEKRCPSGCCECKQGNCVCCIVAEGTANKKGSRSFRLTPGEYDVSFKVADALSGSLSGITIDPKDKEVKLSVTLNARPQK
jgi:hypothetical protein